MNKRTRLTIPMWQEIVLNLGGGNARSKHGVAKRVNHTYVGVCATLIKLKKIKVISMEKEGRKYIVNLTKKGEEVYNGLFKIDSSIGHSLKPFRGRVGGRR